MQLLNTLIDKAGKEISDHAGRSIANLLKGGAGVAFEAVSLKVDYQGLERVAQVARAHASRAETASMRAHRKANARKLETHSAGGKWHVVAVLEAALKSIAEDIFRRLPGALHTVLLDTEKDLEKDIAALKEADARAAEAARSTPRGAEAAPGALALGAGGGKPPIEPPERPIGFAEEPPEEDPAAGAGQFGSGWCWLQVKNGKLEVSKTPNGENPLVHGATPILGCDVWEHSYYIDYRNRRPDYLKAFLDSLVNWDYVDELFGKAV